MFLPSYANLMTKLQEQITSIFWKGLPNSSIHYVFTFVLNGSFLLALFVVQ